MLLRNPGGVLPLRPGQKILVAGPHANATRDLIQVATGRLCPSNTMSCVVSPLQRIRELNIGGSTKHEHGCDLLGDPANDPKHIAAAVAAAKQADVIVLGLGIETCGFNASHSPGHGGKCYQEKLTTGYTFPE